MFYFYELEKRWGGAAAYHFLCEAEKAAQIRSRELESVDSETRLANALRAHDALQVSRAA